MSVALVVTGYSSLTQGFVGPTVLASGWSCRGHDGGAILVGQRECGSIIQDGPPLVFSTGVLLVHAWRCSLVYVTPTSPVSAVTLKGSVEVAGVTPCRSQSFIGLWRTR
jgi:hypothetical protein